MKRTKQLHIYITEAEREMLAREVEATDVKVSEWVRRAIRSHLGLRVPGDRPLTS